MPRPLDERETAFDPAELRFRLDSVPAGAWITFALCAAGLGYALGMADAADRLALAVGFGAAAVGGAAVLALPWERLVRSGAREAAFLSWSLLDVGLILALAALDGGGESALAVILFVPVVFAGLSYPRWSVVVVSAAVLFGYGGLALGTATDAGYALMFSVTLGCTAVMSFWQARNHERRRELLTVASKTDPLTGSLNRRGFHEAAAALMASVVRLGHPASLLLFDLDRFKEFNDRHGHLDGDDLLCWVVARVRDTLRVTDSVARLGGDEFAVLLAGADRRAAQAAVGRLRSDLATRVEASWGVASAPAQGTDLDSLYRAADRELYDAKEARDRERSLDPRPR